MDEPTDQDIDTAGTEADATFDERHRGERIHEPDPTKGPLGGTPETDKTERGSDPRTLHRGEDDQAAFERSPEFHDQPGSGRDLGGPSVAAGDGRLAEVRSEK